MTINSIEADIDCQVTSNVDQEAFDTVVDILVEYTLNMLAVFNEPLDGEKIAIAMSDTIRNCTESGAEGLIAIVSQKVINAFNNETED